VEEKEDNAFVENENMVDDVTAIQAKRGVNSRVLKNASGSGNIRLSSFYNTKHKLGYTDF
jgi:hypothetical protein